ncbi:MAG TPA: FAD-dependent oxidoreductase [Steroidobacteraceae bacterium]
MKRSIAAPGSPSDRGLGWFSRWLGAQAEFFRILRTVGWPPLDLAVRIGLAQGFFVSGVLKVSNWATAVELATNVYPVTWMNPVTAAYTGAAIELVGSVLLAAGLLTRYAALSMLILTAVVQSNYNATDSQLFSAALFGWYVIHGAGPVSMDGLLRRGLADSALPLAARIAALLGWVSARIGPIYLSAVRVWLAVALLVVGVQATLRSDLPLDRLQLWLPISMVQIWPPALLLVGALLLLPGLLTRYAAIALALASAGTAMAMPAAAMGILLFATLALLVMFGAGVVSADAVIGRKLRQIYPELEGKPAFALEGLPRVVIVGAGFGGLACAAALRRARASLTLIDRGNYHLFQPLLYQVATAALSPGDIAAPIRPLFRDSFNTRVLLGTVTGVDTARRRVLVGDKEIPYDYLVLATGAAHSYFGKDQWRPYAPGLKRIEDATAIRRRLLTAFEHAESTEDPAEREALLTFLIVGGGPTGVELAGAIAELARFGMEKEFRNFDPASARVILVQSAARVLPTFAVSLAKIAQRSLERLGVEVLVGSRVEGIDAKGVLVNGKPIVARTVLWAAGVMASPAATWLGTEKDSAGRLIVEPDLSVRALPNVFAIGDTASSNGWAGKPVPGLAPAAKQGGAHVARVISARLRGEPAPGPFTYRHTGSLATIGRKAAVADFGRVKLWGAPAWWLWGIVHVGFLVGLRNRVATMINWFWAYLTFGGGIRLITGGEVQPGAER